jgi:DNA adenine methylase
VEHPAIRPAARARAPRATSVEPAGAATRRRAPALPRPFLKWAGGKSQLLGELRRFVPPTFGAYYEPFVGSGAVFFDLCRGGRLDGHRVVLADTNADLVGCYRALGTDCEAVIAALERLASGHAAQGSRHYYRVRDELFNPARAGIDHDAPEAPYPPELAAMLVYLNRTGYNGLYRQNASGAFNVPAGRYANPSICDAENLRAVAEALNRLEVRLRRDSFESVVAGAAPGDFLYFDPPYAPLSRTAQFTSYTAGGFAEADQVRLRDAVVQLAARGCLVVVSNSTAPLITALYGKHLPARRAGLRAWTVPARRAINSRAPAAGPSSSTSSATSPGVRRAPEGRGAAAAARALLPRRRHPSNRWSGEGGLARARPGSRV